jgi:hypothetical protein
VQAEVGAPMQDGPLFEYRRDENADPALAM